MRLMVCGSRDYDDDYAICSILDGIEDKVAVVIVGDCRGPDAIAKQWADDQGIPVVEFEADWKGHGKAAGPIRNQRMVQDARPTHCMAFWDGVSRGTLDAIQTAVRAGVWVQISPHVARKA